MRIRKTVPWMLVLTGFCFLSNLGLACHPGATDRPAVGIRSEKGSFSVYVEIASTPEDRHRGLMDRKQLMKNEGMLFIFPRDTMSPFWMKDTYIPLDIIFLDKKGVVLHIAPNTTPLSKDLIFSKRPYRYVLEVRSGRAEAMGLAPGLELTLPNYSSP